MAFALQLFFSSSFTFSHSIEVSPVYQAVIDLVAGAAV
jgi:hypothetical protein